MGRKARSKRERRSKKTGNIAENFGTAGSGALSPDEELIVQEDITSSFYLVVVLILATAWTFASALYESASECRVCVGGSRDRKQCLASQQGLMLRWSRVQTAFAAKNDAARLCITARARVACDTVYSWAPKHGPAS